MNRAFYFLGGIVALLSVFLVPYVASVSSHLVVAPNPASVAAPDAGAAAIDALAAWPAAAAG